MRVTTLLNRLLQLPGLRVSGVRFEHETGREEPLLVVEIERRFRLLTCPDCGTRVRGRFEENRRRWRHLAVLGHTTYLEGPIRRMRCPTCEAVVTEEVPWARPGSWFTRAFEDAVGLLAQKLSRTAVAELTGIAWVTVGRIAERLVAEGLDEDRFEGLRRIGIDEISYGSHHRYLTVVVDHDRERVVWAGEGKSSETLGEFFEELGPDRAEALEVVSIDMSAAYEKAVRRYAPQAQIVFDRFHVARLANDAVTEVRREEVRRLDPPEARDVKGSRWLLLKRPEKLRPEEAAKLSAIQRTNRSLYRAYLLKESFLDVFTATHRSDAEQRLREWLAWASRSKLRPFVKLARTVRRHRDGILAFIDTGLTNARLEGMNNKIRLLSHRAFGFHSPGPLIATIYLCCSGISLPQLQLV
jgi:transposase